MATSRVRGSTARLDAICRRTSPWDVFAPMIRFFTREWAGSSCRRLVADPVDSRLNQSAWKFIEHANIDFAAVLTKISGYRGLVVLPTLLSVLDSNTFQETHDEPNCLTRGSRVAPTF